MSWGEFVRVRCPAALFALGIFAGCGNLGAKGSNPPGPGFELNRACDLTGNERFTIHLDGALFGAFEKFYILPQESGPEIAVYENGFFLNSRYLAEWRRYNSQKPRHMEKHDVLVYRISPNLEIQEAAKELIQADVLSVDSAPAMDNPNCLVVRRLSFVPDSVRAPRR